MKTASLRELTHRVHDYPHLVARWRRIARESGLKLEALARAGEFPIYCLRSRARPPYANGIYLSAGIHGDEPAGPEALASWAEARLPTLARPAEAPPLLILPCLNPWGLVNNQRTDQHGHDLNRLFDRANLAPIRELKHLLAGWRFDFGLSLHEDYDAHGIYGYELQEGTPDGDWGPGLLRKVSKVIPIDSRRQIDGRVFKDGWMIRRRQIQRIPVHAETIYLHLQKQTKHTFTFETPSEFSLTRRVQAHVLLIEECMQRLRA